MACYTVDSCLSKDVFTPSRFQRRYLSSGVVVVCGNAGVTDQHCTKLSLIESLLQYRFATPKPLKARPGWECCTTARLCRLGHLGFPSVVRFLFG